MSTEQTDAELKKLEDLCHHVLALAEKATPGPWYTTGQPWFRSCSGVLAGNPDPHVAPMVADCEPWDGHSDEERERFPQLADPDDDAALIAAARTALPTLARALLLRLEAEAWRDISTAPLGRIVWLASDHYQLIRLAHRDKPEDRWIDYERGYPVNWEPSHWQPTPTPPERRHGSL